MLIQSDAAQLEWRVAAWLSGDPIALKEINDKIDFHTENQKLFNLPSRLIAKIYLFRTIFRGTGWGFAKDPDFMHVSDDPDFWEDLNFKFYKKYVGLDKWHKELGKLCAERKTIVSPFGREWLVLPKEVQKVNRFTGNQETTTQIPWSVLTNFPVQGTGSDLVAMARIYILREFKKQKLKSILISTVHDSILSDSPREEVLEASQIMMRGFDQLPEYVWNKFGVDLPCPFPGEIKVGPNMKDMVGLDTYLKSVVQ